MTERGQPSEPPDRAALRRLEALARVVGAPAKGGGLDGLLMEFAEGVLDGFGLGSAVNLLDEDTRTYVVRTVVGSGVDELIGKRVPVIAFESILQPRFEVTTDVYFVAHDADVDVEALGDAAYADRFRWDGPGHWHPDDLCVVRLRSSQGRVVGLLSVDARGGPIPDRGTLDLLRLFAVVGANAIENLQLQGQLATLQAERELEILRRDLFRSVSHELRTPLASIRNLAHMAAKDETDEGRRLEIVDIIGRQTEHLTAILGDLLVAERAAAGRLPISPQEVDVDASIADAVHAAGLTDDARVRVARSSATALADPRRMTQAVTNLLTNAADYAPEGLIHVQAWTDGGTVSIEVEDDGPGIPPDELEAVFSRFQRGSRRDREDGTSTGSGLGLYVTQQLVEAMGGRIACRSQPGIGTRFTIELPASG